MEADDINDGMWLWSVSENDSAITCKQYVKAREYTFKAQSVLESRASL